MILGYKSLVVAALCLLVVCPIQGLDALSGLARLSGPLRTCQALASFSDKVASNRTTDGNGSFNASVGQRPDGVVRVVINPGASCLDIFTNLALPFQLAADLPANATAGSVGYGSFTGLSYLEFAVAAVANTTANSTASTNTSTLAPSNITTVRQNMLTLYGTFNISLAPFRLDPLQLDPLVMVQSANATTRSLAVALLAADVQMGALASLGAALLNAAAAAASNATATTAAAGISAFARAVAAEGARQLMQLEALRQALLLDEAAAAAAAASIANVTAAAGNSAAVGESFRPLPPSPPSPPVSPSAAAVGGLYSSEVAASILDAAARRANVTVPPGALNATAAVVAGMAGYAEVVKDVALLEVGGLRVGLNPLNALITLTRLAVVQADAAAQMSELVGPNPQALQTYVLDALPERLSKASVNVSAIHAALGLPAPAAAGACNGAAHVVGPLSSCMGQANGVWSPSYEAFVTSAAGALGLAAKDQGSVTVTPYRYCQDAITQLQLSMSVSNLGPAGSAVSVSPVGMLAQGFYTLQASAQLTSITLVQQTAAFAAMGLNLTAYNAFMILPPSTNSSSSSNSSSPPPSAASPPPTLTAPNTASQVFNLSHPLMGSVMAANTQLVGLIYAARALFATSCYYAYDMDSTESANTFTSTLTLYGTALQAASSGGFLNLTAHDKLENIFTFVAAACYFNSTTKFGDGSSSPSAAATQATTTGTFLSGGSASAIGATQQRTGRHRRRRSALAAPSSLPGATAAATAALAHHLLHSQALHLGSSSRRSSSSHGGSSHSGSASGVLHRRLRAHLVAAGVTGPEVLLWQRLVDAGLRGGSVDGSVDGAVDGSVDDAVDGTVDGSLDSGWEGGRPASARGGDGLSGGGGGVAGRVRAVPVAGPGGQGGGAVAAVAARSLAVYVDDPDITIVCGKVSEVLSGINAKLQAVQAQSNMAAAAATVSPYNLTDFVATAAELGYVVQQSLYSELANAMGATYSSGLTLVVAVQSIAARYTGAALQQRMAEARINRALICAASGAQCASSPSPSPPSGGGSSTSGKKPSVLLYAGVGLGVGLGVVALLLAAWAVRRAARNRQVKQAVVNNFKTGDMHNMTLRLPSAMPPDGPQGQGLDAYHSVVPAALGSDPTLALDYPLYPVPTLNASTGAYYHYHQLDNHNNGTLGSTSYGGLPANLTLPGGRSVPLNMSLPAPRFPQPPTADIGASSQGPAAPGSGPMPLPLSGLTTQRSALSNSAGAYKAYSNSAYVTADGGAGGGGSDATALRDNLSAGSYMSTRRLLGAVSQLQQQQQQPPAAAAAYGAAGGGGRISNAGNGRISAAVGVGGKPVWQTASLGGPAAQGLYGSGDSGAVGAASLLNGTLGVRRSGLPPLAQYTSVTNTVAPTAALNSSLRTIPVNTNFNSSLRPPPSHRPSQAGRPSER